MGMPGRKFSAGSTYRYGFNGKENDNEVKGEGNQQDYGFRIYDPRLGKFLSTDPITDEYPELTPYQFASNTPIWAIDLDGLEGFVPTGSAQPFSGSDRPIGMIITVPEAAKAPPSVKTLACDVTPFLGTGKGLYEAWIGVDAITGEKLAWWERAVNIVPYVKVFRKGRTVINAVDNFKDVNKTVDGATNTQKTIKNLTNADDVFKKTNFSKAADGSWSKTQYRANLQKQTGKLAKGFDAHHTLPKGAEFSEYFKKAGLDVNDPANLIWRNSAQHSSTATGAAKTKEHSKLWKDFMTDNPNASKEVILKQRDVIEKKVWGNTTGDTPTY